MYTSKLVTVIKDKYLGPLLACLNGKWTSILDSIKTMTHREENFSSFLPDA